jgi:short chain dehydrogenase
MQPTLIFFVIFTVSLSRLSPVNAAASFSGCTRRSIQREGKPMRHKSCFRAKARAFVPFDEESALYNSNQPESEDRPLPSASSFAKSRRDFLSSQQQQASAMMLSSLILGSGPVFADSSSGSAEMSTTILPKTILITGANSGIGLEACKLLSAQGHTLVLACRSLEKAQKAVETIQQGASDQMGRLIPAACDLASLTSMQSFATGLKDTLATETVSIDTLCLNAGVSRNTEAKDCARTKEGFELTGTLLTDSLDWRVSSTI